MHDTRRPHRPKLRRGGIFAGHDFVDSDEVHNWEHCTGFMQSPRWATWCKSCNEVNRQCQDWYVQPDGSRRPDAKAVRSAVIEFADAVQRQITVTYRDDMMSFFWETWLMRK